MLSSAAPASTCALARDEDLAHACRRTAPAPPSPSSCSRGRRPSGRPRPRRPTAVRSATTTAGAGARTTPPSSRVTRWVTPSTSTRCDPVASTATTDQRRPPTPSRLSSGPSRSSSTSTYRPSSSTRYRSPPIRATVSRYTCPRRPSSTVAADLVRGARAAAAGRRQERGPLPRLLGVGDVDGDLHQRDRRRRRPTRRPLTVPARSSQAVSAVPATTSGRSSRSSRNDLVVVPPRRTTVVSRSAQRRRASASGRSRPQAMTLAIIESYSGGMTSPALNAGVDAHARARRAARISSTRAGRRREALLGVLGVEPRLDGVPELAAGHSPSSRPPVGHVQLQLDEVEARRLLGHRVLDLQPGVDLEEREQLLVGLVEELDGARPDVAGGLHQRDRGLAQRPVLLGGERRRAGLLEHLLVAPLHRAVADARRPDRCRAGRR